MNEFNANIIITGLSFSLGSYSISSMEKVSSIVSKESVQNETDKVVKGLGINKTSVAAIGEDVITNASLAIIKLILSYKVNPEEVSNLVVATETPHDISQSIVNPIVRLTNTIIDKLNKNNYNIKHLNPSVGMHLQSACTSAGSAIANYAVNGLKGKAVVVATDKAEYKLGTSADETGGFGSVAVLIEPYEKGKKGILISDKVGHYSDEVPDFIKVIFDDNYASSGLSLVAKYPIVFGKFSEEAYSLAIFEALKDFSIKSKININNKQMLENYDLISHLPFPKIPEKLLSYLIRHISRTDSQLKNELSKDIEKFNSLNNINTKENFLLGFENLEDEFKFVIKFESLYNNSIGLSGEIKNRMSERSRDFVGFSHEDENINKINGIISGINELANQFSYNKIAIEKLNSCKENFKNLLNNGFYKEEDLERGFKPLMESITQFENTDNQYNKVIRSTDTFQSIKKELKVDEAVKLSKEIGNIYTGSLLLSLISYITNLNSVNERNKDLLMAFYGSGFESYVLDAKLNLSESILHNLNQNVKNEFSKQKMIDGKTYLNVRNNINKDTNIPISRDNIFRLESINEKSLFDELNKYANTETIKQKIR